MPLRYFPIADTPDANIHFTDDWGAPRKGHAHQGNDLFSRRGTPIVAPDDGQLTQIADGAPDSAGNMGLSFHLLAPDGTFFYGTHEDAWEGPSRYVHAGDLIGFIGHSGNANDLPASYRDHLHFEIHPNNGPAVDPYPYLVNAPRIVMDDVSEPAPTWLKVGSVFVLVSAAALAAHYAARRTVLGRRLVRAA